MRTSWGTITLRESRPPPFIHPLIHPSLYPPAILLSRDQLSGPEKLGVL